MRTSALPACLARWPVRRVHRACVLACQPCAGERRRASAIAMSGSSRGTTTNCCRAPSCHTNDACGRPEQAPQQTGGRSSSSASRSAARRRSAAAAQRSAAAAKRPVLPCAYGASGTGTGPRRYGYGYGYEYGYPPILSVHSLLRCLYWLLPGRPASARAPRVHFARLALHTAMLSMLLIAPD